VKKLNLTIDDKASRGLDVLPHSLGASTIMRVVLKAISMNEREFEKYKAESKEAQAVRAYLRDKTRLSNFKSLLI
jgi:hypothetical protein